MKWKIIYKLPSNRRATEYHNYPHNKTAKRLDNKSDDVTIARHNKKNFQYETRTQSYKIYHHCAIHLTIFKLNNNFYAQ